MLPAAGRRQRHVRGNRGFGRRWQDACLRRMKRTKQAEVEGSVDLQSQGQVPRILMGAG